MATATELAQEAMQAANGDVLEATAILEQKARGDMDVWRALTDGLLKKACYDACRGICRTERRIIWNAPNYDAGGNGERIKAHSSTLMDWPLPGGMKLKDATKADLIAAAEFYAKQAANMQSISNWLNQIAKKVKNKTVGDSMTDDQLRKLRDDTGTSKRAAA